MATGEAFRALSGGEVHVWYTATAELTREEVEAQRALLSREELDRCARFATEPLRRDAIVARALVRAALSRYADVAPRAWEFRRTELGRPFVTSPPGLPLRFSLSHATGLVCCAVAVEREVGVDAEWLERRGDLEAVADRWFARAEAADIASQPASLRRLRALELWTLKEAYAKARGLGLSLPFDAFAFRLDGGDVRLTLSDRVADDAARWSFDRFAPTPVHLVAVAYTRRGGEGRVRRGSMLPVHP